MEIYSIINGDKVKVMCHPNKRLIDFLREDMRIVSVKEGCGEGECGACTVLIDGKAVTSCTVLTGQIDGCEILTVEGLDKIGELEPLIESFVRNGAVQCGYCTPGMIMSTKALLDENPSPNEEEIKIALEGNLCRCTGYNKIENAIKDLTIKG